MLPAILIFVFYFVFLSSLRSSMAAGRWPLFPGFWVVHLAFLAMAWLVFNWERLTAKRMTKMQGVK
jgi:lipopolysaccharide export system permease protein